MIITYNSTIRSNQHEGLYANSLELIRLMIKLMIKSLNRNHRENITQDIFPSITDGELCVQSWSLKQQSLFSALIWGETFDSPQYVAAIPTDVLHMCWKRPDPCKFISSDGRIEPSRVLGGINTIIVVKSAAMADEGIIKRGFIANSFPAWYWPLPPPTTRVPWEPSTARGSSHLAGEFLSLSKCR